MFRLTREVRFAINDGDDDDEQFTRPPSNSYGGYPSLIGYGRFYTLAVTLAGELDPATGYLRNIKEIDDAVRRRIIPAIRADALGLSAPRPLTPFEQPVVALGLLQSVLPQTLVDAVRLSLSPFLSVSSLASEHPMVRLSQKFEFSASHRLHSAQLSDEENRKCFGKCNNPNGHGHNYTLEVTATGPIDDATGMVIDLVALDTTVRSVLDTLDHKHIDREVPAFAEQTSTAENLVVYLWGELAPRLEGRLRHLKLWETNKNVFEYSA